MHRRITVLTLFAAIAIAGCSTDVAVAPKAPNAPKFALSAAEGTGNYIVLMKGNGNANSFTDRVASLGGTVTYSHAGAGFATVSGLTPAAAASLSAESEVGQIEQDVEIALTAPAAPAEADVTEVSDPSVNSQANPATGLRYVWQWNMRQIKADVAWAAGKLGSPTVTVAILDTGIDYDAPDLTGLVDMTRSRSFMNVYVRPASEAPTNPPKPSDDLTTATYFPTRHPISDYNGHGTNVATQVSSKAFALAGVTSRTTLIGVKVLGSNGSGSLGTVLGGVLHAADAGANVANMSLGGGFSKIGNGQLLSLINRVFNYAKSKGMLIVVSAGNSGLDLQHNGNQFSSYCDAPHVVCVSSVGPTTFTGNADAISYFTNYGRNVATVAAPGGNQPLNAAGTAVTPTPGWPWAVSPANPTGIDIASWVWSYCAKTRIAGWVINPAPAIPVPVLTACTAGNRLTGYIGTSQASPHVAGLAALLFAENPGAQPQTIKHLIESSGDPINPLVGRSRINVQAALGL